MPYGPHAADDRARMLETIGASSVDELFEDIPQALRATPLRLDPPEPELELSARMASLAARNRVDLDSFLGAGAYRHWTPAAVDQLLLRGEWYTAYTPYQPEVSQGTLQSIYEYQSLLGELTGLDVVSASHYDGGAATAEAALMTCRATHRERLLVSRAIHPHYRQTLETYAVGAGLVVDELPIVANGPAAGTTDLAALERLLGDAERPVAGVLAAQPNVLGLLEPMAEIGRLAHAAGALFVSVIEPVSLAVHRPARRARRGHRRRRGPAAGHPARLRRPVPRDRRLYRGADPPDPGSPGGHDHRPRRPAGVRDDDARARAGHPARAGGEQHLHQPGAARAGGIDLSRVDRAPRAAGRGRHGCRPGRRARGRPGGGRRSPDASGAVPQRARGPRARRRRRSCTAARTRACWPASRPSACCPTSRALHDGLLVCATEVTTSAEIERFAAALREELSAAGAPAAAGGARMSVVGRAPPAHPVRAQPAGSRRRQDPASTRGCPRPDPGRRAPGDARRRCPSWPSPRSSATTST